jgi:hypothetical protein
MEGKGNAEPLNPKFKKGCGWVCSSVIRRLNVSPKLGRLYGDLSLPMIYGAEARPGLIRGDGVRWRASRIFSSVVNLHELLENPRQEIIRNVIDESGSPF